MKISQVEQLSIANTCYAIVGGCFADMLNTDNQGPAFNWKDFPNRMAEKCEAEIFLYFDIGDEIKKTAFKKAANKSGQEYANTLVSRAGLCK